MEKKYQIITKTGPDNTWKFVAHGARYNSEESQQVIESYKARGIKARKIAI